MSSMTPLELLNSLRELDEVTLIEILDLHSDEIVAKFEEEILERYDQIKFKVDEPIRVREEERYEPLTGQLSWVTDQEASDFDSENE